MLPPFETAALRTWESQFLSVEAALARALHYARPLEGSETIDLFRASGRVLGTDILASVPQPPFDQSAMDGYAIATRDVERVDVGLVLANSIVAGASALRALAQGTTARIFTGAPIPPAADAVVMQEHVRVDANQVYFDGPVRSGANIRRMGEDIGMGETLAERGTLLDHRHVALLAAQGIETVKVVRRARVGIVSTGLELRQPGEPLAGSQIFDSNRPMLLSLLHRSQVDVVDGGWVSDDCQALASKLVELSWQCDLIVTTGGASVGTEDYTAKALHEAGAEIEILKLALKPGKPAIVGRLGNSAFLGLPGNPVAALVSWLLFGAQMLAQIEGRPAVKRRAYSIRTITHFDRRPGRREFVPARLNADGRGPFVEILGRGGSARLKPLVQADGLVEIDSTHGNIVSGDIVQFCPFDGAFPN